MLDDGVVELPEGLGSLHEGAASSDRSRIRPWMNRRNRKVLVDKTKLVVAFNVLESLVELAAVRALEVSELDDGDASIGGNLRRIVLDVKLGAVGSERGGGHIEHLAAQERLAVFADVDLSGVGLVVDADPDGNNVEIRRGRLAQGAHFDLEIRTPGEQIAHVGVGGLEDLGLIRRHGSLGAVRPRGGLRNARKCGKKN